MRIRTLIIFLAAAVSLASPLSAQEKSEQPITRYVVDLRAALPSLPNSDDVAKPYGLVGTNLPGLGFGVSVGGHVYPLRWKSVALGIGVHGVIGQGHAGPAKQSDGTTTGTDVTSRFSYVSPQISINFGSAAGWSYLSGGMSSARLEIETPDTLASGTQYPKRKTLDYGGGGRWFVKDRMAVTFDIRFYAINPVSATATVKQSPRLRMLVISFGISLR